VDSLTDIQVMAQVRNSAVENSEGGNLWRRQSPHGSNTRQFLCGPALDGL